MSPDADPPSPAQPVEAFITEDRRRTDRTLQTERLETDDLLGAERAKLAEQALVDQNADAGQRLQDVRAQVDAHLDADASVLPRLSESLEEVAATLALSAESGASSRAPADLIHRLVEIAGTMAEVTADLDAERHTADRKLRVEREITDQIIEQQIEQQIEQTETHAAAEQIEQSILADERRATDEDLARERHHTDESIGQIVHALEDERVAHLDVRDEFETRTEFLAIVSHDLRGPLAAASAAAALIAGTAADNPDGARVRGWADRVTRSLATMDRLIRDLLDFASVEDGRLKIVKTDQDIGPLVTHAVEMFSPLASAKALSLTPQLPAAPIVVPYDRARMLQVVSNILQNAIKFTPEGGSIRIEVAESAAECTIRVTDTGVGIPEPELSSIFERFRQLDDDRSGLGLGLYISKWIVEAHGGRIWAESGRGVGATLSVTLPRG